MATPNNEQNAALIREQIYAKLDLGANRTYISQLCEILAPEPLLATSSVKHKGKLAQIFLTKTRLICTRQINGQALKQFTLQLDCVAIHHAPNGLLLKYPGSPPIPLHWSLLHLPSPAFKHHLISLNPKPINALPLPASQTIGISVFSLLAILGLIGNALSPEPPAAERPTTYDKYDAQDACHRNLTQMLKTPSTAKIRFTTSTETGQSRYTLSGVLDSQNSFGAMLRKGFICEFTNGSATATIFE